MCGKSDVFSWYNHKSMQTIREIRRKNALSPYVIKAKRWQNQRLLQHSDTTANIVTANMLFRQFGCEMEQSFALHRRITYPSISKSPTLSTVSSVGHSLYQLIKSVTNSTPLHLLQDQHTPVLALVQSQSNIRIMYHLWNYVLGPNQYQFSLQSALIRSSLHVQTPSLNSVYAAWCKVV
jgi:hypothetical protein